MFRENEMNKIFCVYHRFFENIFRFCYIYNFSSYLLPTSDDFIKCHHTCKLPLLQNSQRIQMLLVSIQSPVKMARLLCLIFVNCKVKWYYCFLISKRYKIKNKVPVQKTTCVYYDLQEIGYFLVSICGNLTYKLNNLYTKMDIFKMKNELIFQLNNH